ncbi:hypothetical protein TREPR_0884 [Treponema primitia ZAS-2]|uniref:Uncharacterized protein n=1 Tax=Treponema primitia (strain ATCC BAA-887 / DSM 12427 / ZAS-2) TaxID=545694 RepID=F5YIL3_TREPZ|nr:hypothetical protein [Treponema primitia]AEF83817.1 hypothetical protein TREPR_0884 [Treponema primitia ZAS-2]
MAKESGVGMDSTDGFQDEDRFSEGIEKITGVLDEAADKLFALAESLNGPDGELEEINTGKTQEEIDAEDELVAQIAGPIVDALDAATAEIYGVTEKVLEMTGDFLNSIFSERG